SLRFSPQRGSTSPRLAMAHTVPGACLHRILSWAQRLLEAGAVIKKTTALHPLCGCQLILEQLIEKPAYPSVDLIANQAHPLDALDAPLGRLVDHPPLARSVGILR